MKIRYLTSTLLLALTSTAVSAASINIRHELQPDHGDKAGAKHADRVAVSHRFANGVGFEVEAKWRSNNEIGEHNQGPFSEFAGNGQQANISYLYRINESFTLTPQYKWESNDTKMGNQFNLTLGYKVNDDWSTSFRHRYHYETRPNVDQSAHYNRWTFGASYRGIENWGLGATVDYTWKQEGEVVYKDDNAGVSEVNFTFEYQGFDSGWRPFGEIGATPSKKDTDEVDSYRPRFRVGMKYNF
ncbi:oligogalacturonate-specific porin KdgM family protein [Vibrio vulnificus]|uniref:oligogalacturonate-specific porin KdgM family protein n=1 Tax=Vibrio vulnificus TaxID=672 RepID=UPI0024DFBFDD|nr:oligogalacturonate-specific porin KdgM family protein [Vibrio vulnificus]MDK2614569.1 oligogalacturonate-specific porin KdgM family protein [Vibrio vulnificus]MDK2672141.1 oligogalacturonate-specific porin KdgM family protein [Vibrio vulnificus]